MAESSTKILELSAEVVASYVLNNKIEASAIPGLIASVHAALTAVADGKPEETSPELRPAVSIKKSVTPDAIICLEDGLAFKSMKRHLSTKYGMSPDEYRAKWGLPPTYPMVAANYTATRSALAKSMGLGQLRGRAASPAPSTPPTPAPKKKKGRPRKAA